MFRSRLFMRMFLLAMPVLAVFSFGLYIFAVPLIKTTAFEIEQNAGRTILNNIFDIANRIHFNLERHRATAMRAHERQLKNIVMLAEAFARQTMKDAREGGASEQEARAHFYESLRTFLYGNNDYVWIADFNSILVSHPDPDFHHEYPSTPDGEVARDVVSEMVEIAKKDGEGFLEYDWRRLGVTEKLSRKLSYFRAFPEWQIVIGTGVYIDDVNEELELQRKEAIEELRESMRKIQIAKTGYLYIFDSNFNMIIHPNPNIEDTNFADLTDPLSGRKIADQLVSAVDNPEGLLYKWDKPSDPGNYAYDKLAWVRHFKGFDWYIASSVYAEEMYRSSQVLGNRILTISVIGLILSVLFMYIFIRRLTQPISELADIAKRVQQGDLYVHSTVQSGDEIGQLSLAFNDMVDKIRANIGNLDAKVRKRTHELEESNRHLTAANQAQEQARHEVVKSEQRQRLILDAVPAYIGYLDVDRCLLFANRSFAQLINRFVTLKPGTPLDEALPRVFLKQLLPHLDKAYDGHVVNFESVGMEDENDGIVRKNTFVPELLEEGRIGGLFFLSVDVTEEKQVETRLMEAQRIRAVGQLSGGLAHDFNNILSVIIGNLSTACDKFGERPDIAEYIGPALKAGRSGAEIASRLLAFSRKQPLSPQTIDLKAHVSETIQLISGSIPGHIAIDLAPNSENSSAFIDPNQLQNALVNLALNARDVMPDGGKLSFKVSSWTETSHDGFDEPLPDAPLTAITVEDSGPGFSPEALEHALEPFFTTKHAEGGTGLGLSMVYGFVKQSEGFLRIDHSELGGARVTLLLPSRPALDSVDYVAKDHASEEHKRWPGKLALLVDDNADVRTTVRLQLLELGFSILEAANADEALRLVENVDDVYIMISDIIMPGELNGFQLAQKCHTNWPDLNILLMTGYAPEMEQTGSDNMPFKILKKPFDLQELEAALIQTIANSHGEENG